MEHDEIYIPSFKLNYDGPRVGRTNRNYKKIGFPKQLAICWTLFEGITYWAV